MKDNIVGIQQVGVGIPNVLKAWEYYRKNFGMDVPIFQESAEAKLMTKYTGGKVHSRSAVLAINLNGGSGLEIWQYTSRESEKPKFELELGDLGIFITKIKAKIIKVASFSVSKTLNKESFKWYLFFTSNLDPIFFIKIACTSSVLSLSQDISKAVILVGESNNFFAISIFTKAYW